MGSVSKPSGALERVTTPLPSLPRDIFGVEMLHLEVLFIQKRQRYSCGSAASTAQTLTAYLLTESSMKASANRVWTPSDVDDFLSTLKNRLLRRSRGGDVGMKDVGPAHAH